MRALTFKKGRIMRGISTKKNSQGRLLVLGTKSQNGKQTLVEMCKDDPPNIKRGNIFSASITTEGNLSGLKDQKNRSILLRINAFSKNGEGLSGQINVKEGNHQLVAEGVGSTNGSRQTWPDVLMVLCSGCVVEVHPKGHPLEISYRLKCKKGVLHFEKLEERYLRRSSSRH